MALRERFTIALRLNPYNDRVAWRSKFGALSERVDVSEDTREGLRRAVVVMDSIAQD